MNTTKQSVSAPHEVFIVSSGNQALAQSVASPGTPLQAPGATTKNILNGQLGVVSRSFNGTRAFGEFLQAAETVADAPIISIVQGTPNSADFSQMNVLSGSEDPAVVESAYIDGNKAVAFYGRIADNPVYEAALLGNVAAGTGEIPVQDVTHYRLSLKLTGVREDFWFGSSNNNTLDIDFVTPDFTALGTVSGLDWIVKRAVYDIDNHSQGLHAFTQSTGRGNRPVIAFAVNSTGGTGTALSAVAAGTPIPTMVKNGVTISYTPDQTFEDTITDLVAAAASANHNITGTSTIEPANMTTAGAAADADVILFVTLDSPTAMVMDMNEYQKVYLELGFEGGFRLVSGDALGTNKVVPAYEGQGQGRSLYIRYWRFARGSEWNQQRFGMNHLMITPPNYIDQDQEYNVFIIQHLSNRVKTYNDEDPTVHTTILLVPSTAGVGEANTVADLNLILTPWLASLPFTEGHVPLFA